MRGITSTLKTETVSPFATRVSTKLHGVASRKAAPLIFTAVILNNDYMRHMNGLQLFDQLLNCAMSVSKFPWRLFPIWWYLWEPAVKDLSLWIPTHSLELSSFKNQNWNLSLTLGRMNPLCTIQPHLRSILGALVKLRNANICFVMHVCLSVHPHGEIRLPLDGYAWNLIILYINYQLDALIIIYS